MERLITIMPTIPSLGSTAILGEEMGEEMLPKFQELRSHLMAVCWPQLGAQLKESVCIFLVIYRMEPTLHL